MATKGKIRFIRSYARNVGTSLKNYIIPSALLGVNPELKSFYDDNKSFAEELRDQAKDLKDTVREQIRAFIKEDNLVKQGWRNAKKGLRTGKWHDFAASKAAQDEAMQSMMGDMGFDFNLEDEDASFKEEFDKESMDVGFMEDIANKVGVSQQSSALMSADMIGGTISKTSAQSMLHITQMTSVLTTSLNAINSSIVKLHSDFVNPINDHLKNFTKFSDSTTNELQKQTQYLKQISETLTKQFEDKEPKKKETRDYWADVFGTDGLKLPNFRKWWEIGLEKAKEDNPFSFVDPSQIKGFLGQMAASPVSFAVTSYLQNQMQKGFIGKSFKNMSNLARVAADKLSDYVHSKAGGDGLLDSLIGLFDIKKSRARTTSLDYSAYNKEIARWTGRDSRALQTVIPTQLSEIISLLSGQPPKMFDYEAGTWKTTRQIQKEFESKVITNMTNAIDSNLISRFTEEVSDIKDSNIRSKYAETLKEFLLLAAGNEKSNFSKYKTKEDYQKSDAYKQLTKDNNRLDLTLLDRLLDRAWADRSNEAIPNLTYQLDSAVQNIRNQHDRFIANISTDRGSRAYIDSKNGANLNTAVSSINALLNQQGSHNAQLFDYLGDILTTLKTQTEYLYLPYNLGESSKNRAGEKIYKDYKKSLKVDTANQYTPSTNATQQSSNIISSNASNITTSQINQIHEDDTSISGLSIFDILKRGNHELKYSANKDIKWSSDVDEEFKKSVNEATNRAIEDDKARANPFYQIYKGFEIALANVITGKTYDSYDQLQKERKSSKDAAVKKGLVGVLQDLPKALNETVAKPIIDQSKLGWKGIQGSGFLGKIASSIMGDAETVKDKALEYLKELGFTGDALDEQMRDRGFDPDDTGSSSSSSSQSTTVSNTSQASNTQQTKPSGNVKTERNDLIESWLTNFKLKQVGKNATKSKKSHREKLLNILDSRRKPDDKKMALLEYLANNKLPGSTLTDDTIIDIVDQINPSLLAKGGMITKSGMASVSEGEIVIPAKYNPFYNNRLTDKQRDDIEQANFEKWLQSGAPGGQYFGKYKDGGVVSTDTAAKAAPVPNDPENKDYFGEAAHGIVNSISKKIESGIDLLFGDDSKESTKYKKKNVEITDLVQENLPKYIGRTALGGLLGHIVLSSPYGLLGGLVAGAGISLYRDYKEASNKVFGKQEDGKENKSKWLSWLPQKTQKFISGSLPNVAKAGLLGAGLSLLPLSPFGLLGGMATAAGLELVFGAKRIREFLFGDTKNKKGAIPTIKEFLFGSKDKKKASFFSELKKNWIDPVPLFFRNISDMASSKFDALGIEIKKFGRSLKYGVIEPAKRFFQYDWAKTKYDVIDPTKRFLQLDWIKTKQHMKSMKDKAVGWLQDRKWGRFLINDAQRTYEDFKSAKEKTKAFVKKSGKNILKGTAIGAGILGLGGLAVTGTWMPAAIAAGLGGIAGMRHLNPYLRDRNILKGRSSLSAEERFAAYNRMEMGDSFKKLSEENQQAVLQQLAIAQNLNVSPDDRQKAYDTIKTILNTAYEQKELKQEDFEALNNNLSQLQLGKSNIDTVANDVNATKQRTMAHRYTRAIVSGKANADNLSKLFSSMSHVRNQDKYNNTFEEFKNKFNNLNIKHVGKFSRTAFNQILEQIQEAVAGQDSKRLAEITKQIKDLPISPNEKSDLVILMSKMVKEYKTNNKAASEASELARSIFGDDVDLNSLKHLILNPQMSSDIKRLKKQTDSNSSAKLMPEIKQNASTATPSVSQQNRALKADQMEHPVQNEILGNTGKLVQLVGQIVDQQSSNTSKTKNNKGSRKNKSKKDNTPEEIKEEPQQDSDILPVPDIQQEQEEQQAPNQAEPENQPPKDVKKSIMSSIHTANDITETLNYASRGLFRQLPLFKMINWASKAGKMFGKAKGGKVKKSGLASVSEGEMIVPNLSDYAAKTTPFEQALGNQTKPKDGEKKVELVNGIPTEYIYRDGEWNLNTTDSETKRSIETQDIRNEFYRKMIESDFFEVIKNLKSQSDDDKENIDKAKKDADSLLGGFGGGIASKLKSIITNPYVLGGAATLLAGLVFYKNGKTTAGTKYDPQMRRGMNPEARKKQAEEAGLIANIANGIDASVNQITGKDMTTYGNEDYVSDTFTQRMSKTLGKMGLRGLASHGAASGAGRGLAGMAADTSRFAARGSVINSLWKASGKLPKWARILSRASLAPFKLASSAGNAISHGAFAGIKGVENFTTGMAAKAARLEAKAAKMGAKGMIRTSTHSSFLAQSKLRMVQGPVHGLLARLQNVFNGMFARLIKYFPKIAISSTSVSRASREISLRIVSVLERKGVQKAAQFAGRFVPVVGQAAMLIFTGNAILEGFLDGRAKVILGILDKPTIWQKIVASTVAGLNEFFLFGLIPTQYLVDIIMWGLSLVGLQNKEYYAQRKEAEKKLAEYNAENGTTYNLEEYVVNVLGENTSLGQWGAKTWDKTQSIFTGKRQLEAQHDEQVDKLSKEDRFATNIAKREKLYQLNKQREAQGLPQIYSIAEYDKVTTASPELQQTGSGSGLLETIRGWFGRKSDSVMESAKNITDVKLGVDSGEAVESMADIASNPLLTKDNVYQQLHKSMDPLTKVIKQLTGKSVPPDKLTKIIIGTISRILNLLKPAQKKAILNFLKKSNKYGHDFIRTLETSSKWGASANVLKCLGATFKIVALKDLLPNCLNATVPQNTKIILGIVTEPTPIERFVAGLLVLFHELIPFMTVVFKPEHFATIVLESFNMASNGLMASLPNLDPQDIFNLSLIEKRHSSKKIVTKAAKTDKRINNVETYLQIRHKENKTDFGTYLGEATTPDPQDIWNPNVKKSGGASGISNNDDELIATFDGVSKFFNKLGNDIPDMTKMISDFWRSSDPKINKNANDKRTIDKYISKKKSPTDSFSNSIVNAVGGVLRIINNVVRPFRSLADISSSYINKIADKAPNTGIIGGIKRTASNAWNWLKDTFTGSDSDDEISESSDEATEETGSGTIHQTQLGNYTPFGNSTIDKIGCGPAALATVRNLLGDGTNTTTVAKEISGGITKNGVTVGAIAQNLKNRTGRPSQIVKGKQDIASLAKRQKPIIALGKNSSNRHKSNSPFGPHNHYVAIRGMKNGKVIVDDPEQNRTVAYNKRILNDINVGIAAGQSGIENANTENKEKPKVEAKPATATETKSATTKPTATLPTSEPDQTAKSNSLLDSFDGTNISDLISKGFSIGAKALVDKLDPETAKFVKLIFGSVFGNEESNQSNGSSGSEGGITGDIDAENATNENGELFPIVTSRADLDKDREAYRKIINTSPGDAYPPPKEGLHDPEYISLPNCTGWGNARFNYVYCKLKGIKPYVAYSFFENPPSWIERVKNRKYGPDDIIKNPPSLPDLVYSKEPQVGALICWRRYSDSRRGHVAFVEKVSDDKNTIWISESAYGGFRSGPPIIQFGDIHRNNGKWTYNDAYEFMGFILNPAVAEISKAGGFKGTKKGTISGQSYEYDLWKFILNNIIGDAFKKHNLDLSDAQIQKGAKVWTAAIMGNLMAESSLDPTAQGDHGKAYGIAQWNSRKDKLVEWSKTNKLPVSDWKTQIKFMKYELNSNEIKSLNYIVQHPLLPIKEATIQFNNRYERSGDTQVSRDGSSYIILNQSQIDKRVNNAKLFYNKYKNGAPNVKPSPKPSLTSSATPTPKNSQINRNKTQPTNASTHQENLLKKYYQMTGVMNPSKAKLAQFDNTVIKNKTWKPVYMRKLFEYERAHEVNGDNIKIMEGLRTRVKDDYNKAFMNAQGPVPIDDPNKYVLSKQELFNRYSKDDTEQIINTPKSAWTMNMVPQPEYTNPKDPLIPISVEGTTGQGSGLIQKIGDISNKIFNTPKRSKQLTSSVSPNKTRISPSSSQSIQPNRTIQQFTTSNIDYTKMLEYLKIIADNTQFNQAIPKLVEILGSTLGVMSNMNKTNAELATVNGVSTALASKANSYSKEINSIQNDIAILAQKMLQTAQAI